MCDLFAADHPDWTDEQLYQHARKYIGGMIQSITYNEWLPSMGVFLPLYQGYDDSIHPQLLNVFTAAAFRLGHTLLNGNIVAMDNDGNELPDSPFGLRDLFFDKPSRPRFAWKSKVLDGAPRCANYNYINK